MRRAIAGLGDEAAAAMHFLLCVMIYGERFARDGALLQADLVAMDSERRFLRRQARHERFHELAFAAVARQLTVHYRVPDLPRIPQILVRWKKATVAHARAGRLAESLLIQQVYLEGIGHAILRQLDVDLSMAGNPLKRLRRLIVQQEAEHHEFGVRLLQRQVASAPAIAVGLERLGDSLYLEAGELLGELGGYFAAADTTPANYLDSFRAELPVDCPGVPV